MADALLVGVLQEGVERRAVGLDAVRHQLLADDVLHAPGELVGPRQRQGRAGAGKRPLDAPSPGFVEGVEQVHRHPRIALHDLALERDRVHDRIDAGLLDVFHLDVEIVRKQPRHVRMALLEAGRRMRRQRRVDLARNQHPAQTLVRRRRVFDALRQVELHLLQPARLIDAGLEPFDRGQIDAVLMLNKAARIDRRGLRPFRNADAPALEIGGRLHRAVAADVDRRMPRHPRRKHRDCHDRRCALRNQRAVLAHRNFGCVEIPIVELAKEDFLDLEIEKRQVDALHRHAAGGQVGDMIVVAARERQRQ